MIVNTYCCESETKGKEEDKIIENQTVTYLVQEKKEDIYIYSLCFFLLLYCVTYNNLGNVASEERGNQ